MNNNRFSLSAKTYNRHAGPQQALINALSTLLPQRAPCRILELGCGTGLLTRRLVEKYQTIPIDAIDLSAGMIDHCRTVFADQPHISWETADAQTFQSEQAYPLIISSSALHWTEDLTETFLQIHRNLMPGGIFALGMMLEGTLCELRDLRKKHTPNKVFGTQLPSFEKTKKSLLDSGFIVEKTEPFKQRFVYASAISFLRALHEQGVTGGSLERGYTPLTNRELQALLRAYQSTYQTEGGVYASYETATFMARKNA